ncbi:MaoC family dehydratase [Deferrisoma palaeochoriense]
MKTVGEIRMGERARLVREVTDVDLALFGAASGDVNPVHFDEEYAGATFFRGRIAHGILCASFISAVIAGKLPGLGTIYVSQTLKFKAPVRIGDRITAEVEVLEVDPEKNRVRLKTTCTNQDGVVVLDGEAVVMPPKRKLDARALEDVAQRQALVERTLASAREAFGRVWQGGDESAPEPLRPAEGVAGWMALWTGQMLDAQRRSRDMLLSWVGLWDQGTREMVAAWRKSLDQWRDVWTPRRDVH